MSFSIDVIGEWLGGTTDAEDATFASLLIKAGGVPLTEVDDTIARSTRTSIRVPAVLVAEWLLSNWWRLRWEARPEGPARAWRHVHSMAALDSGFAWPPLEIASDGERIEIVMAREASRDAAAIRYLNGGAGLEIPAGEFDAAVDAFVDRISERIDAVGASSVVRALRDELRQERMDPKLARQCRWQARAGIDPGEAPEAWLAGIERVSKEAGPASTEDMLGATGPSTTPSALEAVADAMRKATTKVDLGSLARASGARNGERAAWVRGCEAASRARTELGIGEGPVSNRRLGEILGASLPVVATRPGPVAGGIRDDDAGGAVRVLVPSPRSTSQRFYFARLLGLASELGGGERVIPVSNAATAIQKFGRAFGQEFLLPWKELEAFADENGTDEEAILEASERYEVSEMMVTTALVNRGKLGRERLGRFEG